MIDRFGPRVGHLNLSCCPGGRDISIILGNKMLLLPGHTKYILDDQIFTVKLFISTFKHNTKFSKGLFTRREGYPSKRVTLAFAHFLLFFFDMFARQLHCRVTRVAR